MKKLRNMDVTAIQIIVDALGMNAKGLKKSPEEVEIRETIETIQLSALLKLARILYKNPGDLRRCAVTQTSNSPSLHLCRGVRLHLC